MALRKFIDILLVIIMAIGITVMFFIIINYLDPEKKYYHVNSSWPIDTGTITHKGLGKTGTTTMEYKYNGITYNLYTYLDVYGLRVGEKYLIRINPDHPNKFVVLDWLPIFQNGEKTDTCQGVIEKVFKFSLNASDSFFSNTGVTFSYSINNTVFTRSQILPPDYKLLYPELKKGQTYPVEYWTYDPERSIIHIHK